MPFTIASLWQAPAINPVNNKAQSIPIFNPFNIYGRVFLLSGWSFFIAFWSWYAFPPLLTVTIKKDLNLTQNQIANSNIVALTATLIVRLTAGAACDRFGPRWTFVAILLGEQLSQYSSLGQQRDHVAKRKASEPGSRHCAFDLFTPLSRSC